MGTGDASNVDLHVVLFYLYFSTQRQVALMWVTYLKAVSREDLLEWVLTLMTGVDIFKSADIAEQSATLPPLL
jgi:hypothetical protein